MATVLDLCDQGLLIKLDADLPGGQQELRMTYLHPRVQKWLESDLHDLEPRWTTELSPAEQLAAFVEIWASGDAILIGHQVKPLVHLGDGIWEFKTEDIRMFGWFVARDCFICSAIDDATRVKSLHLYRPYCEQACRDRDALPLSGAKFVSGSNPIDVVSNFSFP